MLSTITIEIVLWNIAYASKERLQWLDGKCHGSGADGGSLDVPQIVFCNINASGIALLIKTFKVSLRIWPRLEQWTTRHSQKGQTVFSTFITNA